MTDQQLSLLGGNRWDDIAPRELRDACIGYAPTDVLNSPHRLREWLRTRHLLHPVHAALVERFERSKHDD